MFDMLAYGGNPTAWIIILVIVLLLFGAGRIPEMMRGLGSGMKEFKKGLKEDEEDENTKGGGTKPETTNV
jgi:sec-independent protein translocase protein TatA